MTVEGRKVGRIKGKREASEGGKEKSRRVERKGRGKQR